MLEGRLNAGELCNVDALLGCSVYAPKEEVYAKFESLAQKEQHIALSCLFYIANWFRELINAFVTQKNKEYKGKVSLRFVPVDDTKFISIAVSSNEYQTNF